MLQRQDHPKDLSVCPGDLDKATKKRRNIIGRNHHSGTTLRPILCPHPENKVTISPNAHVALRKLLNR